MHSVTYIEYAQFVSSFGKWMNLDVDQNTVT